MSLGWPRNTRRGLSLGELREDGGVGGGWCCCRWILLFLPWILLWMRGLMMDLELWVEGWMDMAMDGAEVMDLGMEVDERVA